MDPQATAEPERPIRTKSEDLLDRGGFVARLCDALINRQTGLATGVTLGLTGEWGSGKSSVLNLLDQEIAERYPNAVISRFDPWLISGRDDLILQFFSDLQASIKNKSTTLVDVLDKIKRYSAHLAPLANFALPGAGNAACGTIGLINEVFGRDTTLHNLREELLMTLKDAGVPIVVLIDELDRIEDVEIRAVAQLVRAVADFPSISYIIAYDPNRVIQALGGGDSADLAGRGRAYLEKIVQFQTPLPVTFDEELKGLLLAELDKLTIDVVLPDGWQSNGRFLTLLSTMIPRPIATPRDIRRLIGTFHVLGSMLRDEVDWVDLLAFSVLLIKAPATVAKLRQNPDRVVENPFSSRAFYELHSESSSDTDGWERVIPEQDAAPGVADLLTFLFPRLSRNDLRNERHSDSLCFWRPLLTVLRMGLPGGAVSRKSIETLLSSCPEQIEQILWELHEHGKLSALLERFATIYTQVCDVDHDSVWLGVSRFLRRRDSLWPHAYSPMRAAIHEFSESVIYICGATPDLRQMMPKTIRLLIGDGDDYLSSGILWDQVRHHGLFKATKSDRGIDILPIEEAERISLDRAKSFRDRHLTSSLAVQMLDPKPIFLAVDVGEWDQSCRKKIETLIQSDAGIDAFILMLFGRIYTTGREFIAELMDLDVYLKRVETRMASESLKSGHPTLRKALEKALGRP